jgi:NADH dehydrogenase
MAPMATVLVTGGTGFVGRSVVAALLRRGHQVRCLVRPGSAHRLADLPRVTAVPGDVTHPGSLPAAMVGSEVLVHLVGIIRERPGRGVTFDRLHTEVTRNVVAAARGSGVRRVVHMSALGTRSGARSRYHQTKWAAEQALRESGLHWTIFRPSVIFGPGDGFVSLLARLVRWFPIVPVIGDGRNRFQPVAVGDVAEGFARAVERPGTAGAAFDVGGPRAYTFDEVLDEVGAALGRRRIPKLHHPVGLVAPVVRALEWLPLLPVTSDQLLMLGENNTCDPEPWARAFDITPVDFVAGIRAYLR